MTLLIISVYLSLKGATLALLSSYLGAYCRDMFAHALVHKNTFRHVIQSIYRFMWYTKFMWLFKMSKNTNTL